MKYFLLIAGDNYYPEHSTGDWIKCYSTRVEAEKQVTKLPIPIEYYTRGKNKGKPKPINSYEVSRVKINNQEYDWYEIIDLRMWIDDTRDDEVYISQR